MIMIKATFERPLSPKLNRRLALFTVGILFVQLFSLAISTRAANEYWVGAGSDTNSPTSGIWTNSTLLTWSDGAVPSANAAWTNGNSAIFGGADGTYGIRV